MALIAKLRRTRLLSVAGVRHLLQAVHANGINLMALLHVAAGLHADRIALADERERLSYQALWQQAHALACALQAAHGIRPGHKVAIACRNHAAAVKALFALSRLGAHVFLLNPEMSASQWQALDTRERFDFHVHDEALAAVFAADPSLQRRSLPAFHPTGPSIDHLARQPAPAGVRLKRRSAGHIVVMTGGTTGEPKAASRKPDVLDFLPPFAALLNAIHLDRYRSLYIATPLHHGFGLSALLVGVALGAQMHLTARFDAASACALIAGKEIEAVTLVPLMLQRLLNHDASALASLRWVISGGATLAPALARAALAQLGPVVFNLYGSSEAGFAILATPDQLARKPTSIGRPVPGVRARIADTTNHEAEPHAVGRLAIRSAWTTHKPHWIDTGDLAWRDADGDIVLCGRADDMVVSGGENVYPIELENAIGEHPDIAAVAVVGIADAEFGQRLKAVVVTRAGSALDPAALRAWLQPRIARHQMPAQIAFRDALPCTALGKPDKRALQDEAS